jgi:hypothetical protein
MAQGPPPPMMSTKSASSHLPAGFLSAGAKGRWLQNDRALKINDMADLCRYRLWIFRTLRKIRPISKKQRRQTE